MFSYLDLLIQSFNAVFVLTMMTRIYSCQVMIVITLAIASCSGTDRDSGIIQGHTNTTECPPWYYQDSEGKCSFIHEMMQIVHQYGNTSELEIGYCMTTTNTSIVVAQCPYIPIGTNFHHIYHNIYQPLPMNLDSLNSAMCSPYNRRGYLCSECKEDHGLAAFRYYGLECVPCSNTTLSLIAYLALLFIPPTAFFLAFVLLKINFNSGNVSGLLFYSQIVVTTTFFFPSLTTLPQSVFGYWPLQIIMSFYGIWNMMFMEYLLPPFCVSRHLSTLQLISLGYVSSVYPLLLCVLTYWLIELHDSGNRVLIKLWRPFRLFLKRWKFLKTDQSSVIHTFGSFILLSYSKNLFVSFSLLQSYTIASLNQTTYTIESLPPLAVDLKTRFFSHHYLPFFTLGIVGGLLMSLLPLVLVGIFPTCLFPRLIGCCGLRRWHGLRTFLEVFTGSYKTGTGEEKRDFRFIAAVYLIARIIVAMSWSKHGPTTVFFQYYSWLVTGVPFVIAAVFFAFFKPHRQLSSNALDILLLLLMAKLCFIFHFIYERYVSDATLKVLLLIVIIDIAIPQVVFILYNIYRVLLALKHLWCKNSSMSSGCCPDENETRHLLQNIDDER